MRTFLKILKHPLFLAIFLGFFIRFYGFLNFPVLHDEVMSILAGVEKTKNSIIDFFFGASLKNCLGLTPLYFWIERFFTDIFGKNNIGLRIFPLISGIFTSILAYFVIKKIFPEKIAFLSSIFVVFSSNFIWSTSKSQYFEVIILPAWFLVFYFIFSNVKNKFLFASFFFFLMFFTYFGKALAIFLVFLFWFFVTKIFEIYCKKFSSKETKKEILQLFSFLMILLIWFILAEYFVFSKGPIINEVGLEKVKNILEMIILTTFGYGTATKQFLAGSQRGAFLIFDDLKIWPTETFLFFSFLVGLILVLKKTVKNIKEKSLEEFKINSFLFFCTVLPLIYIFSLGLISARFHFLYFIPFVLISALGFEKILNFWFENKKLFVTIILLWITHLSYTNSWENWYYKIFNFNIFYLSLFLSLIGVGLIFCVFSFIKKPEKIKNFVFFLLIIILFILNLFYGPFVWGRNAEWEPAFDNKLKPCPTCYAEKSEKELIDYAIIKKNPTICKKLPESFQKVCLENFQ